MDIIAKIRVAIDQAETIAALEAIKVQYLGKKGMITAQLKQLGQLSAEARSTAGKELNILKNTVQRLLTEKSQQFMQQEVRQKLQAESIDITLPGRRRALGSLHPITHSQERLRQFFNAQGFTSVEGPEIEDEFHNFTALNIPNNHPARASHDTFYFSDTHLLRTHTSSVQIRVLEKQAPPLRVIAMGRVYRCDYDMTHTPMFHQIEGLVIEEQASFAHLKALIHQWLHFFFEQDLPIRFRPSYFPFTEPSVEVDMGCTNCQQKGCQVCKQTGWLEVLGAGMVHPAVLRQMQIDPDRYQGYAFGAGIDRLTMLRYGIRDLRWLFENDLHFLSQFK